MKIQPSQLLQLAGCLGLAVIGALGAKALGLPIPFLLGSLFFSASLSLSFFARTGRRIWYPQPLRKAAIAAIGTMIGTTVAPDIIALLPGLTVTLCAMMVFIALAQGAGYGIFRHIGGYDRVTAAYAAMPGGLIEAVTLGEKAGGDVETLSVQHFARIVLVVLIVPALFYFWTGVAVGSASGQTMAHAASGWTDWAEIPVLAVCGIFVGQKLRLPAGHMIGPLLLTAVLHAFGVLSINSPPVLLNLSQLIVGAGLGTMFARSTLPRLLKSFVLGAVSVVAMLAIGMVFAITLSRFVPMTFEALLVSFAPGGVTEMGLIALSLGVSPVLVVAHHLFRIIFTVAVAGFLTRKYAKV